MHIERLDPLDLDLDTAEALAGVTNDAHRADGVGMPPRSGPTTLRWLQLQSEGDPVDGLWLARTPEGEVLGGAVLSLPRRENTGTAQLFGAVRPDARGNGIGRLLVEEALALAAGQGRTTAYTSSFEGSPGNDALPALGFTRLGTVDAIRRLDLHDGSADRWQRLYDEAHAHAVDYELVRLLGPTPPEMLEDLATLHAAINDAPPDDPDLEGDVWSTDRVAAYDRAMAGRRQTVHRVLARHRASGAWAGMSILCVDEFSPAVAFQEDTSVVPQHRGHRLGLLMKADLLRWITLERPEVGATITWNATTNHHMIAVNERLGSTVVSRNVNYRKELGTP